MTDTFAPPADAADAIAERAVHLRLEAHRASHAAAEWGGNYNFQADMAHHLKAAQDDVFLECLSQVLGTDEPAAEAYIAGWATRNGIDPDPATVRIQDMPTASQLFIQRAEAEILATLREAGTAGLPRKTLLPMLAKLGWREEETWIKRTLNAGTMVERQRGRSTVYVHSAATAPHPEGPAEPTP
ncbi:hypothetical protein ACFYS8_20140 [Kitasatospora sp. NPDC004615]|uniref:hypothetical protein n=1 Tax=unclassified Kitasatospora TaxID=2633591 RepID=UPI0036C81E06